MLQLVLFLIETEVLRGEGGRFLGGWETQTVYLTRKFVMGMCQYRHDQVRMKDGVLW